ncbi:MAG: serine/threonine protein kinase [Sandaracinaceae bacterium]|nr:serine/threonine protein kinase [Sandaracinaceae bacterium]
MSPGTSSMAASTLAPDPRLSEEVRHRMQERLALLGLVTLCLGGGFLAVELVTDLVLSGLDVAVQHAISWRGSLNFVGALVSAAVWLVARSGTRSPQQLLLIDGVGTVAAVVPYTLMAMLGQEGVAAVLLTALTSMLVLVTRALMVPSDATRTATIGSIAASLAFGLGVLVHVQDPARRGEDTLSTVLINLAMWLVVVVVVSTVASWVLFGLRRQADEARRLGQYILIEPIGAGGMGVVYRARHSMLRRPTALKLLPPESTDAAAIGRFEREVQLTASLQHPNTVTIFDYGRTSDGVFYYAMEYLDGGDLETVVAVGGPMPAARVRHLLLQVAAGLAEAHDIGLIHRDIKPANLLVAGAAPVADLCKIVDFGLVRQQDTAETTGITQTGTVMGTPLYMAPEAITHPDELDARADLYALGAVAYYLLTGQTVFEGQTIVEICSAHLHAAPEPPSARLGAPIPPTLEELVLRCLEKSPDDRPQSAVELGELLEACEDVPAWTRAEARAWWAEHGAAVQRGRRGDAPSATAATLAVDFRRR